MLVAAAELLRRDVKTCLYTLMIIVLHHLRWFYEAVGIRGVVIGKPGVSPKPYHILTLFMLVAAVELFQLDVKTDKVE